MKFSLCEGVWDPSSESVMKLGPFEIAHPFILAPMAGITHSPFRRLMRRHQSALSFSELISANGIEYASARTLPLCHFHPEERLLGFQLFGENEAILCRAAQALERQGADFIDLNLGCPVTKVVQKGAGAALCRNPVLLGKILTALVQSVRIPVTIKTRTGWDSATCPLSGVEKVVQIATDSGVRWVTIHGRTRAQGYRGQADWEVIGNVKAKALIPIIGNGDLTTPESAVQKIQTYGVDAVLIGRGALRNPFIFEQSFALWQGQTYQVPGGDQYLSLIAEQRQIFDETGVDPQNTFFSLLQSRKFLAWYSVGFPGCHDFRRKIFTLMDGSLLWEEANRFFEQAFARNGEVLSDPFLMGGHG